MTEQERYLDYLTMLRRPFQKLCRLRFLQPDGSTAFSIDNNPVNARAGAFISDGTITGNWQTGRRRSATVTLSNVDGAYDYNVNQVWFGTEIALDEGLVLSDGSEFYIQQGIFLVENPQEVVKPGSRTATYNLADKVANLDGSLLGNLESTYEVLAKTNIYTPIASLLSEDRGNGQPLDRVTPIFTEYYNDKKQCLPDQDPSDPSTWEPMTNAPYTLTVDGGQTKWNVIEGLASMLNAWAGYDTNGAFRLDPSQDDILDKDKPVVWDFSMKECTFLGATYTVKNSDVFNDYIVVGELLDDNSQPKARAQILDPLSPVNIQTIGRKTKRVTKAGYGTNTQCEDYAIWMIKRAAVLQRAVTISCTQFFHNCLNELVTIHRTDKAGNPVERHLVQGFSRPLSGVGEMTLNVVSVLDYPNATLVSASN